MRALDHHAPGQRGLPPADDHGRSRQPDAVLREGRRGRRLRRRRAHGARGAARQPALRLPHGARAPGGGRPDRDARGRPRPRLAAVVLPVGRAARPGTASTWRKSGKLTAPGMLEKQAAAPARRSARRGPRRRASRRSGCACRTSTRSSPIRTSSRTSTRTSRAAMKRETELFFNDLVTRDTQLPRLLHGRLHVRERAPGAALRHPERRRHAVPPRHLSRRHAPRHPRPRQRARADVARQPHVAGAARQVGDGGAARHAAAGAAAQRARRSRNRRAPRTARC